MPLFAPAFELAAASLRSAPVLVLDVQATGPSSAGGTLLELGWAVTSADRDLEPGRVRSRLLRGARRLPPAVARLTGLAAADLARGVDPAAAWLELLAGAPGAAVAHFASFEAPFLRQLQQETGVPARPLDLHCTHAMARRLLPELPRRTLRALAGFFGRTVPALRRSAEHVAATAFVWRELVALLAETAGVHTFGALHAWLEEPPPRRTRVFPMARPLRLAVPDAPGVYRLERAGGGVLYVGKALSLRRRVNSHFHDRRGRHERTLEMLSQARGLEVEVTETALEAALLECDEIKRLRPPYNVALAAQGRAAWFSGADFRGVQAGRADAEGPFPSPAAPSVVATLAQVLGGAAPTAEQRALALGVDVRWAPPAACFRRGLARFAAAERLGTEAGPQTLLRLGARLGRRRMAAPGAADPAPELVLTPERPAGSWDAERVSEGLAEALLRAAHAVRRARWLRRLQDCVLLWSEGARTRRLQVRGGEVIAREWLEADAPLGPGPVPSGREAPADLATLDRLRVLGTELRRLVAEAERVELALASRGRFDRGALARVLPWV